MGRPQPGAHPRAVNGENSRQHRSMRGHAPMVGSGIGDDEPDAHTDRLPASAVGDLRSQSPSAIHRAEKVLDVDDDGLEFDYQQSTRRSVERQDIDDAAFTKDRERDFRRDDPFRHRTEQPRHLLVHRRMPCIQQPIEFIAAPTQSNVQLRVECSGETFHGLEAQPLQMATFGQRYCTARHLGAPRKVGLGPAASEPNGPKCGTHPFQIHAAMLSQRPYETTTWRFVATQPACPRPGPSPAAVRSR
jgi:hypothetical protein